MLKYNKWPENVYIGKGVGYGNLVEVYRIYDTHQGHTIKHAIEIGSFFLKRESGKGKGVEPNLEAILKEVKKIARKSKE